MFGNHGLCGLLEGGAHEKSPKCLGGTLGDLGEFCKGLGPCAAVAFAVGFAAYSEMLPQGAAVAFVLGQLCVAHGNLSCRKGCMLPPYWPFSVRESCTSNANPPPSETFQTAKDSYISLTWGSINKYIMATMVIPILSKMHYVFP